MFGCFEVFIHSFFFSSPLHPRTGNVHDEIIAALGLHEWQFSMAVSIFFVSYVTLEIPSNLILRRVPSNLWLGGLVLAFGLISTATIFAKEFWQLLLIRLALGAAEAGLFPGLVFYLTQYWYNVRLFSFLFLPNIFTDL
tara:strand:- start:890 stop:1306 length:417 start_codon:yes stop_codon:yes gene_type:complete